MPWGQQHVAQCPTSHLPTPQAAFAHLALAFRCDMFTLQQRVLVEKRARDAAEENIQEELGQCRAALEVGGHQAGGWHMLGSSSPRGVWPTQSASSSSSILSLHRGWADPVPVQAARRRWSSCSTTWPCCQPLLSGQPVLRRSWGLYTRCVHSPGLAGMEGATDSSLGLLGFVPPQVLALTSCLRLPGCKGSIRLPLGAGRGGTCTPWVEAPWHAQGGTGRDLAP